MKILYIWDADYPWDVRVEKICCSLVEDGHEVHIAARNLKRRPLYERVDGLHVHRLWTWRNQWLNYAASFPLFCSPVWRKFLDSIIRSTGIDLVIVRDLPMAIGGIWAGRRAGIPVILDMAEDYVSMIRDIWDDRKFQGLNLVVRNPYLAKIVERYTFNRVDEIIVVVEEAREVIARAGGSVGKVTIVGNTPVLDVSSAGDVGEQDDMLTSIRDGYSAIYTGGIQLGRGLQVVFNAIPEIVRHVADFRFVVVGDGYASERLKQEMRDKGVEEYVLWLGWIPHQDLRKYLAACRIGLVPHYTSAHVNTTIPNKIFDYMACGLPVLASDAPPMKRIIEEEKCGKVFPSGNPHALAKALLEMRGHEGEMGANGRRATLTKYNWQEDKARLLGLVRRMGH